MDAVSGTNPGDASVLAHVGDPTPAPDHSVFWKAWYTRLRSRNPVLRLRDAGDPSDPTATHEFLGDNGVRLGCSLVMPKGIPARGAVVFVHGAGDPGPLHAQTLRWRKITRAGVAVLCVRLRGFAGSRLDLADHDIGWRAEGDAWFTRGLTDEKHESWVVPQMVSDVCDAVRTLRGALDDGWAGDSVPDCPIVLAGRSLGGGLATIAAAQLNGRESGEDPVSRLVLWQPSLGDVRWRLGCAPTGVYGPVRDAVGALDGDRAEAVMNRLVLCDAVVHARRVRVPTLAQLALEDPVVPPETGAGVYNAIHADPGRKWRVCVPMGHTELTRGVARREILFRRVMLDFVDPDRRPMDAMAVWEPLIAPC